jgi:hypothetical protein
MPSYALMMYGAMTPPALNATVNELFAPKEDVTALTGAPAVHATGVAKHSH